MNAIAKEYKNELLENIIPFWMDHSIDRQYGGYFTALDRYGKVYDTDKFIWLQARQVWMFSMLCDKVELKEDWMNIAKHGADFLDKYGKDEKGNFYFSLNREGRPLIQPYNIFSDCFAAMAFGALYKIAPEEKYADLAGATFRNILSRKDNPKGIYNKSYPGTRPLRNFSLPMILSNLAIELDAILGKDEVDRFVPEVIHEVMEVFYQKDSGLILENVNKDGSFSDTLEGRLINPGHGIEAMWFMMDLGSRFRDRSLIQKAVDITISTLEFGWDKEFGGLYYFMDIKGCPPDQLEWNHKLWWVHLETLVCLAKAYQLTGNGQCKDWFYKVHEYTWSHFRDPQYPEWFGYLDREGKVQIPLKGGKWKGCFHVPRALYQVWKTLEKPVEDPNCTGQ